MAFVSEQYKNKEHISGKSVLLDLVTVCFSLGTGFLLWGSEYRFTNLSLVRELSLERYALLFVFLFCALQLLRLVYGAKPIFTLLPGLTAGLYFIVTLFQEAPASYGIGLAFGLSITVYLCLPVYRKIWREQNALSKFLIVLQVVMLMTIVFTVTALISMNLPILQESPDYLDLLKHMTELLLLVILAMICFVVGNRFLKKRLMKRDKSKIYLFILSLIYLCLLGGLLVVRVIALRTPTYDFGLFSQMFYYMKSTGQALTTLERNGLLSHFSIHVSPIYYLLLPFYLLWPKPETLQILQVLVVLSGLIPLLLLNRHFRVKKSYQAILSFLYLFHPAIFGSSLYDLHENCFLAPLILWLLYFIEKDKRLMLVITTLLIFAVKEDAAMYVVIIGLFMWASHKRRWTGALLMLGGTVYFFLAIYYLDSYGNGAMFGRFSSLMANKSWGFPGILITIVTNPGYFLNELFIPPKLMFIMTVFPALGFLPLLQRRYSRLLLLLPILIMNLMPYYHYQYELIFQYHYATTVLMIYLLLLFLADTDRAVAPASDSNEPNRQPQRSRMIRQATVSIALYLALISTVFFTAKLIARTSGSVSYLIENRSTIASIKNELDKIPSDASVEASGMLTTYLSSRDLLYDLEYNQRDKSPHQTDYVVVDQRYTVAETTLSYIDRLLSEGFTVMVDKPGEVLILSKLKS